MVPRQLMKSKFLDQDVDEVLLLANNVLLVFAERFISRNYDKILKEMGKVLNSSFWHPLSLTIALHRLHMRPC